MGVFYYMPERNGLTIPTLDSNFIIEKSTWELFRSIVSLSKAGVVTNVLLTGAAGTGKTSIAEQFAAKMNYRFLKMDCSLVRESRHWFGDRTASGGNIYWDRSLFAEAVSEGGGLVVLLDEISRASPLVLNGLLPLLDHTRSTYLEEIKDVLTVGPSVFFFATANIGGQFSGTHRLDAALVDRFDIRINTHYLSLEDETRLLVAKAGIEPELALKLATIASNIRREVAAGSSLTVPVSTRTLISTARLFRDMNSSGRGGAAFRYTILPLYSSEGGANSERTQVLQLLQAQFGAEISLD